MIWLNDVFLWRYFNRREALIAVYMLCACKSRSLVAFRLAAENELDRYCCSLPIWTLEISNAGFSSL